MAKAIYNANCKILSSLINYQVLLCGELSLKEQSAQDGRLRLDGLRQVISDISYFIAHGSNTDLGPISTNPSCTYESLKECTTIFDKNIDNVLEKLSIAKKEAEEKLEQRRRNLSRFQSTFGERANALETRLQSIDSDCTIMNSANILETMAEIEENTREMMEFMTSML